MPITLPGKDGEWEQVDNDVVKLGCTLGYKKNNGSATEAQLLDAIAECIGGEVCYVQYVVYKKIKAPEWQKREKGRMKDRKLPIWSKEEFWEENTTIHALHFVHVSEKDDKLLAYTQSPEKGERDIQTPIKPGRYLRQYFGEVLSEKRIAFLAAWQANGVRPEDVGAQDVLRFATTPDQIAKVYIDGPASCMSGRHFLDIKTHPARVYGAGDLAIAYLEKEKTGKSKPIARALVWPEKKVAGRVYPSSENWPQDGFISAAESEKTKNILSSLLKEEGYRFVGEGGSFEGARLLKVDHPWYNHMWLLPYLDNNLRITKGNKEFFYINNTEGVRSSSTGGGVNKSLFVFARCYECGVDLEDESNAIGGYSPFSRPTNTPQRTMNFCKCCADLYTFVCEESGYRFHKSQETVVSFGGRKVAQGWLNATHFKSALSKKWFAFADNAPVLMWNYYTWEQQEFAEHGFTCAITGTNYPNKERSKKYPEVSKHHDVDTAVTVVSDLTIHQKSAVMHVANNKHRDDSRRKSKKDLREKGILDNGDYLTPLGLVVVWLLKRSGNS